MTKTKPEPTGSLRTPQPNSMVTQLCELEVNACLARAGRIDGDAYSKTVYDDLLNGLRNTMNKAAQRAKARAGGEYIIEAGSFRTLSGDYIVSVVATRTS